MALSSISFLIFFLAPLLCIYYVVPARFRALRNGVLLLFSLGFYAFGGLYYLALLLLSIAVTYACGLLIDIARTERAKKCSIVLSVLLGLSGIAWFKYSAFFADTLNALGFGLAVPETALPIGISFYTFQGLSYVMDVYRGSAKCQRNPLYAPCFRSLWPAPLSAIRR